MIRIPALTSANIFLFQKYISLMIIVDLVIRAMDWDFFYSIETYQLTGGEPGLLINYPMSFCFHNINDSITYFLFGLQFFLSILNIFGVYPRLTLFINWILLVSLHNYNPFVLYGGDVLLRNFVFISIVITPNNERRFNFGNLALWLLVFFMYFMSFYYKINSLEWQNLAAIENSLKIDQLVTSFGKMLSEYHNLLPGFTAFTLVYELFLPFLLLLVGGKIRVFTLALVVAFHSGISLFLNVGLFSLLSYSFVIAYWPINSQESCLLKVKTIHMSRMKSFSLSSLAILSICFMCYVNIGQLISKPSEQNSIISFLRFDQQWNMFQAPSSQHKNNVNYYYSEEPIEKLELKIEMTPIILSNHRWIKFFNSYYPNDSSVLGLFYLKKKCLGAHFSQDFILAFYREDKAGDIVKFELSCLARIVGEGSS